MNLILILLGKIFIYLSRLFNLGNGSTWPGHIALSLNRNFIKEILNNSKTKVVIIAGTNGKTTTGRLVTSIIREDGKSYLQNKAGANLINGLASTIINGSSVFSFARRCLAELDYDYLIFESDENALPQILNQTSPDYLICLNLFRDQLDRYGEIDSIAKKWKKSFDKLDMSSTLILNADDPQVSFLGRSTKAKVKYFGLNEKGGKETKHGADSTHCPKCSEKLEYKTVYFSHLGTWECPNCKLRKPNTNFSKLSTYPIEGTYNKYNSLAAALFAKSDDIKENTVYKAIKSFTPAFGRGEKIIYKDRKIQIFLSKNPTSFNESLKTVKELGGKNLMLILNDRIPDGLDISWIWDINFEDILTKDMNIAVTGDRAFDMATRLKYGSFFVHHNENPKIILNNMFNALDSNETLYILPNYSAMLDVRKTLTGKKIL